MTDTKQSNEPEMKGWLHKWTNYIKGYQKRWFVLSNGVLSYYRYVFVHFNYAARVIRFTMTLCDCHQEPSRDGPHMSRFHPPSGSHNSYRGLLQLCHFKRWNNNFSSSSYIRSGETALGDCFRACQGKGHQSQRFRLHFFYFYISFILKH